MALFTPEELEELKRIDAELDESFTQSQEEIRDSRKRDRAAKLDGMDRKKRKIAERNAAYREANKDKIAEYQAAYREANKDKIAEYQAAYREANKDKIAERNAAWKRNNREKWNAYQREYRRRKRAEKKNAAPGVRDRKAAWD